MRIIQHRLSRRNSLTLLQLQSMLGDKEGMLEKKSTHSAISKKSAQSKGIKTKALLEQSGDDLHGSIISEDKSSEESSMRSEASNVLYQDSEIMKIQVMSPNLIARKSQCFSSLLKNIGDNLAVLTEVDTKKE